MIKFANKHQLIGIVALIAIKALTASGLSLQSGGCGGGLTPHRPPHTIQNFSSYFPAFCDWVGDGTTQNSNHSTRAAQLTN